MFTIFRREKSADRHAGWQVVPSRAPGAGAGSRSPAPSPGLGLAPGYGEAVRLHTELGTSWTFVCHLFPVGEAHGSVS